MNEQEIGMSNRTTGPARNFWPIARSILMIVAGVLMLVAIYRDFTVNLSFFNTLVALLGILLTIGGVVDLWRRGQAKR